MTACDTAALYAADRVYREVYELLPRIAAWSKYPVNVLRARFERDHLPLLRSMVQIRWKRLVDDVN